MPDLFSPISVRDSFSSPDLSGNFDLPVITPVQQGNNITVNSLFPARNSSVLTQGSQDYQDLFDSLTPIKGYEYTKEQQERYDTQYRPYKVLGSDIEDTYANNQSGWSQLGNGLAKMATTAGGTFVSNFLAVPQIIDHVLGNEVEGYQDGSWFKAVQDWTQSFENRLPNYYSQLERDREDAGEWYKNIFTTNFWGDKVIKNLGFTIGTIGSVIASDALLALVPGIGVTGAIANTSLALSKMKNAWGAVNNVAQEARLVEAAISGSRTAKNLIDASQALATANNLKNGFQFALRTYLSAQGEAAIEGYHVYDQMKKDMYKQAMEEGWDEQKINEIEQRAGKAGSTTALLNLPILALSNVVQFNRLLRGKGRMDGNEFIKYGIKDGALRASSSLTNKEIAKQVGKDMVKSIFTEGGEEAAQGFTGSSVRDFYELKYDPNVRSSITKFIFSDENLNKNLNAELAQEAFIGGITGFLTGGIGGIKYRKQKQQTQEAADELNSSLDRFDLLTRGIKAETRDELVSHFNTVLEQKKFGNFENFQKNLSELKGLTVEDYNETFGTRFGNKTEKDQFLSKLIQDNESFSQKIELVNNAYQNPYDKGLKAWFDDKFSNQTEQEKRKLNRYFYNQWKDSVAFNLAQVEKLDNLSGQLKESFQQKAVPKEAVAFFQTFFTGNKSGFEEYIKSKKVQRNALLKELQYQRSLEKSSETAINTKELEKRVSQLETLINLIQDKKPSLTKSYETVEEVSKEEKDLRSEIFEAILLEEISLEDLEQVFSDISQKELLEEAEELSEVEIPLSNARQEFEDNASESPATAQQIVDLEENNNAVLIEEDTPEIEQPNVQVGDTLEVDGQLFEVVSVDDFIFVVKNAQGQVFRAADNEKDFFFENNPPGVEGVSFPFIKKEKQQPVESTLESKKEPKIETPTEVKESKKEKKKIIDLRLNKQTKEGVVFYTVDRIWSSGEKTSGGIKISKDEFLSEFKINETKDTINDLFKDVVEVVIKEIRMGENLSGITITVINKDRLSTELELSFKTPKDLNSFEFFLESVLGNNLRKPGESKNNIDNVQDDSKLENHVYTTLAVFSVDMKEGDLLYFQGTFIVKRGEDGLYAYYPPMKNGKILKGEGLAKNLPHVAYTIKKPTKEEIQTDVQKFLGDTKGYTTYFNQLKKQGKIEIQC